METKSKHEEKICPRCGRSFECRVGDVLQCQCYGVVLTAVQEGQIKQRYDDCLCRACLEELAAE